ncbi:hypothetical protein [Arthrobacter sp. AET 35A]|uniref:hypothetical protein n=1 Tax=Arthrobacter sp. AET 35A TaxID=2292643 RepID=UPI00177E9DC0|nr:hypothetical protein [Arthrobacter sp. AET 35A]
MRIKKRQLGIAAGLLAIAAPLTGVQHGRWAQGDRVPAQRVVRRHRVIHVGFLRRQPNE